MVSTFLKDNFKSMKMTDDEREKYNKFIKNMTGTAVSENELEMLKNTFLKKLLEEKE